MLRKILLGVSILCSLCLFAFLILFFRSYRSKAQGNTLLMVTKLQGDHYLSYSDIKGTVALYTLSGKIMELTDVQFALQPDGTFISNLTLPTTVNTTSAFAFYIKPQGYLGKFFCSETTTGSSCTNPQFFITSDFTRVNLTGSPFLAGDTSPADGMVDNQDISRIVAQLGQERRGPTSDVNGDGFTNVYDFALAISSLLRNIRDEAAIFATPSATPTQNPLSPVPTSAPLASQVYAYKAPTPDTSFQGTAGQTPLQFETVVSNDRSSWKTTIARFATTGSVSVKITAPHVSLSELRSPTGIIPSTFSGNTVSFTLPGGSGVYTLRTNNNRPQLETIVLWVDDLARVAQTAPVGATVVSPGGNLQSAIDSATPGTTLYLTAGLHQAGTISIKNRQSLTLLLHPEAILSQNSSEENFINILNSSQIKILGPGRIVTPDDNPKTSMEIRGSSNLEFGDFFLYKKHERDGWTFHVYQCSGVTANYVRIISGNDGSDPDSSSNVIFNGMHIESQDDAVAVKTRANQDINGFTFKNGFAKSAASALKIGEATIKKRVDNVQFVDSTVFDSDRAMVITPSCGDDDGGCDGSIGTVLYKNITVYNMQNYRMGKTIRIEIGGSYLKNTSVIFDGLKADFISTAVTNNEVTIRNSTLRGMSAIKLFTGVCPKLSDNQIQWAGGTGQVGCGN